MCTASTDQCSSCNAGFEFNSGLFRCDACSTGTYALAGSSSCTTCTSIACQTCNVNTGTCTGCNAGYELNSSSICVACPAGKYNSAGGVSACINCTLTGGCATCLTTADTCTGCSAGYFFTSGNSSCNACPTNQWAAAGTDNSCADCLSLTPQCSDCTATTGSCTGCNAGYQINGNVCDQCVAGKFKSVTGTAACINCTLTGGCATCLTTADTCTGCSAGYFFTSGNSSCNACPTNQWAAAGTNTSCVSCVAVSGNT